LLTLVYNVSEDSELPTTNFTVHTYGTGIGAEKLREFYTAAHAAAATNAFWPKPAYSVDDLLTLINQSTGDGREGVADEALLSAVKVPRELATASAVQAARSSARLSRSNLNFKVSV
jgi:hypothetical protein